MFSTLIDSIMSMGVKQLTALLAAVAAVATVLTLAMPVLSPNVLDITTDALTRMSNRLRSLPLMNSAPRLARRRGGEGIPKKSSQHC